MKINDYILPNIDEIKPFHINNSIEKIKESSLYKEGNEFSFNKDQFEISYNKLKINMDLNIRDCRVLIQRIDVIAKDEYYNRFYKIFTRKIMKVKYKGYFIRALIKYLYDEIDKYYVKSIYNFLKKIIEDINHSNSLSKAYSKLSNKIKISGNLEDFLSSIKKEYSCVKDIDSIDKLNREYCINQTNFFYSECISDFICNNYLKRALWDFSSNSINVMTLEQQKSIFKIIMRNYENEYNIDKYPEDWFRLIEHYLKEPFDPVNTRWHNMKDEAEIFRRWNIKVNIEKFFEREVIGGDRRRKEFWKKYINNIYRINFFKDLERFLVMEFESHTIIEFANKNNACYCYDKSYLDLIKIENNIINARLSKSKKIKKLKVKEQARFNIGHRDSKYYKWEDKFERELKKQGYKKGRYY